MANPAPTINQINAFNATQGTTIDFNIIGGTELVRSNRIYIYDLSDNSLICTHLYVSTESIHELPANTDSSIVYESGKSSADFVNGAQYYAQIQTYTDTAGTEGGSGLSVAKMFWCLVDPTLTVTTIPSTISTTSYNVSATYDANTSVVSNIIQQYQFSLYSATGSLLQSSGVVVGNGEQQGTSTAYDISYNFSGLSVGSSYYVVVDVTTTQGMSVSAQSSTFTVSIDTPTLGEATVVNNACDGYISVTSNLSGEYGGSASGEIATFETDSVNDVSSLKVTLTPQQDGTPWIGTTHDTTPYLHRVMPTQSNDYNRESGVIVGGTVGWNQLVQNGDFSDGILHWTGARGNITATDGELTYEITDIGVNFFDNQVIQGVPDARMNIPANHVIFLNCETYAPNDNEFYMSVRTNQIGQSGVGITRERPTPNKWSKFSKVGKTTGLVTDIAFYWSMNTNYAVGDSVKLRNAFIIDLTAMFGSTIADYIYSLEQATAGAGVAWFRKYFPEDYYPYSANTLQSVQATAHKTYDADDNVLGNYALDSSLTLRGIPKLDASNNLYYDGDTYASDGTVTREWHHVEYDGSSDEGWIISGATQNNQYIIRAEDAKMTYEGQGNIVCNILSPINGGDGYNSNTVVGVALWGGGETGQIRVSLDLATVNRDVSAFRAWLSTHPLEIDYRVETPTTETADPYTNPQIVDPYGTEEYVTANYVPVGHDSTYSLVCPISGYDEVSANVRGKNWIPVSCQSTVRHGITYTVYKNDSGEVTRIHAEGTSTASHSYTFVGGHNANNPFRIKAGSYWLKGLSDGHGGSFDFNMRKLGQTQDIVQVTDKVPLVLDEDTDFQSCYLYVYAGKTLNTDIYPMVWSQSETSDDYEPYQGQTYTADLGQTVYGGTVDLVSGVLTVDRAMVTYSSVYSVAQGTSAPLYYWMFAASPKAPTNNVADLISDQYVLGGFEIGKCYVTNVGQLIVAVPADQTLNTKALADAWLEQNPVQFCYKLATPQTIQLTPQEIQTLLGTNNVWSDSGDVEITYNIPITNLLVKRQDVADVSGTWLTLYSQPITQASDMDFTFIDFTNQYGKTYKYALVPLLTQTQSGVEVEVEGGYTVSDEVQSIFDGVFIADSTGSQKCKANVGYGDVDMNQAVGTITPIGAKYPVVITNSKNQYHNGSISGTIVPDDYYFNGNLSRIDMVNKRNELEQFLTNKRAKIIKDWNGNTWLVMIMENINCTFNNEYGMGIVNFTANWIEVGDPTNQEDLQATGLIDVGGV